MLELSGCAEGGVILAALALATTTLASFGLLWRRAARARNASQRLEGELETVRQSEEQFRSLVWNTSDVILILDPDGTIRYQSPSAERVWGYRPEALRGKNALDLVHSDDLSRAQNLLQQVRRSPRLSIAAELRVLSADGAWSYFEIVAKNLVSDSRVGGVVATYRDIAERKELEAVLTRQAFYDPLTHLPNRALFVDRLTHALARADGRDESVAVLFLDLDNFKVVNDSLGHQTGDELLVAVAGRIQSSLRAEDSVARLGGDEFTILVESLAEPGEASAVAERLLHHLRAPFMLDGREVFITSSVGIAISSPGEDQPEGLLRDADLAMYRAKSCGKAGYEVFHRGMNAQAMKRLELETDLRRAVDRGEFKVLYQPIVRLTDGQVVAVEALVRWEHPKRGLVSPAEFIPAAEENGLILPIGRLVLAAAARQAREWQRSFPSQPPLTLSVNLSARQFQHARLVEEFAEILEQSGLDPASLELEITESAMMQDATAAVETLNRLKALGIHIAMDDFGTGYSSLAYLRRFPIDVLKIDRSFVDRLGEDPESTAIVRSVITLAKTLSLTVTAEGIETVEQLAELRAMGCDLGQGYYFSRPLSGESGPAILSAGASLVGSPMPSLRSVTHSGTDAAIPMGKSA